MTSNSSASVKQIRKYLDAYVAGQDEAKDVIAAAGFIHFSKTLYRLKYTTDTQMPLRSSNALLMGPSGCGKTYMVQKMADCLGLPFIEVNARSLTQEGYRGNSLSDLFEKYYYNQSLKGRVKMNNAVVLLDEYDKICMESRATGGWDLSLQHLLLKAIEGTYIRFSEKSGGIDTKNMMFVLGGNFESIRKMREINKRPMGFGSTDAPKPDAIQDELIKAGVIREVVGRISLIGEVTQLTREQLLYAFVKAENSIYAQYKELYEHIYGKQLRLNQAQIENIVDSCVERKVGARGLHAALDSYMVNHLKRQEINVEEFLDEFTFLS